MGIRPHSASAARARLFPDIEATEVGVAAIPGREEGRVMNGRRDVSDLRNDVGQKDFWFGVTGLGLAAFAAILMAIIT
jgi:hypothetical protein